MESGGRGTVVCASTQVAQSTRVRIEPPIKADGREELLGRESIR